MTGFSALVTFLPVANLAVAHEFYAGTLGLRLALDQGTCRIYQVATGCFVGVCEHLDREIAGGITTLVTDDVDGWYRRLVARGVTPDGPPRHNPRFGIYHFFVTDPAGNRLEIQRFEAPGLSAEEGANGEGLP